MSNVSFKLKPLAKWIFILLILSASIYILHFYFLKPRWSAHLFSDANNGKDPEFTGDFQNLEECQSDSLKRIAEKYRMQNGYPASSYACGQDCYFDGIVGSVFIEEIQCNKLYFSNEGKN